MTDQRRTKDRRADALDSVIDTLTKARKRMSVIDQRLDDMAMGWPSGAEGGSEVLHAHEAGEDCNDQCEALEYQSSTEANALNPKRDVVGPDKRRRDQILLKLGVLANELDDIDRKYLGGGDGTKPPDPPGCQVVGRFKGRDGKPYWESAERADGTLRRTDGRAFLVNPEGEFNHGETITVGRWAYEFGRNAGRWPNKAEVERHLRGEDVRVAPVDVEKPERRRRGWQRRAVA